MIVSHILGDMDAQTILGKARSQATRTSARLKLSHAMEYLKNREFFLRRPRVKFERSRGIDAQAPRCLSLQRRSR